MTDDPRPTVGAGADSAAGFPRDPDTGPVGPGTGSGRGPGSDLRPPTSVMVAVIAAGGIVGSLGRYQIGLSWPTPVSGFPWATLTINVVGCLLIGVLIVLVTERFRAHPLLRPLLGTGVLGGFTTFSTYTVDIHRLLLNGHALTALGYLAATAVAAVAAAAVGMVVTRRLSGVR